MLVCWPVPLKSKVELAREKRPSKVMGTPATVKFWDVTVAPRVLIVPAATTIPLALSLAVSICMETVSVRNCALAVPVTVTTDWPPVKVAANGFSVRVQLVPWVWNGPEALPEAVPVPAAVTVTANGLRASGVEAPVKASVPAPSSFTWLSLVSPPLGFSSVRVVAVVTMSPSESALPVIDSPVVAVIFCTSKVLSVVDDQKSCRPPTPGTAPVPLNWKFCSAGSSTVSPVRVTRLLKVSVPVGLKPTSIGLPVAFHKAPSAIRSPRNNREATVTSAGVMRASNCSMVSRCVSRVLGASGLVCVFLEPKRR